MPVETLGARIEAQSRTDLLRFITCGSVDDGKSTLIGRLLHDAQLLLDDQLGRLTEDSRRHGTQGDALDFALLVDGLQAEREQGITIDVAYRQFATDRRRFIVADCPGHVQYTRNMATGASTADVAVVLVDARKGLLAQTRRHTAICALLGIRDVVLAVNKMDLAGFDPAVFDAIASQYRALVLRLGIERVTAIPVSALQGENIVERSVRMPWYGGPALLEHLEAVQPLVAGSGAALRMPVQLALRPDAGFRGVAGTPVAGRVAPGDEVVVLPSGRRVRVASVLGPDGAMADASAGTPVVLTFDDELDIARGDMIAAADAPPEVADQFSAHLLWMGDEALLPGRPYWLKIGTRTVVAQVTEIRHKLDVETQDHLAARELQLNEVGRCHLHLDQAVAFEPYARNRALGGFILIDRESNATVGAGTIEFALRRAANLHWQAMDVDRGMRARALGQKPACIWFTGLSGAGKSTIANLLDRRLHAAGRHACVLDGDNIRHGLNKDLGFTDADRVENIRRVAEVARLMVDAGLIVLVSFISPFRAERRMARELFAEGEFIEVFVDTPLELAEQRDAKGLYAKARAGLLPNFTGIDSPYEPQESAELVLQTATHDPGELAERVFDWLRHRDAG